MLAYVFWHRPAAGVHEDDYERSLARFHHSLAENAPAGFASSLTFRTAEVPWLEARPGDQPVAYEDWYLVENWTALGVLEAAAVSRVHAAAHQRAAGRMGAGTGAVYRLLEGAVGLGDVRLALWVSRPADSGDPQLAELLEDGFDPARSALFGRSLLLGPAPELCLLSAESTMGAETGISGARLAAGWSVVAGAREPLVG